ncbi:MAG TPA: glycosyltransferase [Candidatus Krumholzibacteria bacterium]|nr:glycosyltransferase [Candidatus Krumholzibacteria bacterium]
MSRPSDSAAAGGPLVVLHSVPRWLPQTETWLYTQVRFLPPSIESHVACERTENLDQFPLANMHSMRAEPAWRSLRDRALRKLRIRNHLGYQDGAARRSRARVMHSHFGFTGWRDLAVARRHGLAHAVTFYGADVQFYPRRNPVWRGRYRAMFARVDRVLCEGPHMGREIMALGCPEAKIRVHHLGVDLSLIPFAPRVWAPGEPLRVLLSGSFREKKGLPLAVEALGRLGSDVALEITIIGDATNEERSIREKQRILDAIARHDLGARTRLLGYRPYRDVMDEARRHHVFLSPSVTAEDGDTEGGAPVSLIEMSASGMMIASSTHCDIPGVILDGRTGFLAPERDVDGLVANLRRIVANPSAWGAMQRAGRAHIEAEFDARRQGERLAAIYHEIVAERPRTSPRAAAGGR